MTAASAWRTARERILWPSVVAMLPWSRGYALLERLAAHVHPDDDVSAAIDGIRPFAHVGDRREWAKRFRLTQLVDHSDLFLLRTRGRRWFDRHVDVYGAWPQRGPYIATTFHWGAGLWAIEHIHRAGVAAHFLSARIERHGFTDAIAYRYAVARIRTVEAAGGGSSIYIGGASAAILDTLASGDVVVALYDPPPDITRDTLIAKVCGQSVNLPAGLAKVAVQAAVPVVAFAMGIDFQTGRRQLHIDPAFVASTPQQFADRLANALTRAIERESAAWHYCALAPQFLSSRVPLPTALSECTASG